MRWWHALILVVAMVLGWFAIQAPAALADMAAHPVGDWRAFVMSRGTVVILAVYALVFVRSYHPLVGVAMICTVAGLGLRIGLGQVTQEPLTIGYSLLLVSLAIIPIRVIIRPNADDLLATQTTTIRTLTARIAELEGQDDHS
ncbi:hypothetical protein [Deinococcus sp. 6GRE01]|uniref:hypothetical protein n=1 Tax=Deinococcus sp. 6GRE01 TaxID=2745873 RepID=UPI001E33951B|nr:hypothetical protein [Deinococcus sp. 6GRE01]MCD0155996.1 hypothetical protein [Deinococcus sp. 6GRE01]